MTQSTTPKEPLPIRLVFKLERAEHPRLYDDLIRFHKGVKRVSRLRLLAYDGLLVQEGFWLRDGSARGVSLGGPRADEGANAVTNGLFEPAIDR